MKIVVYTLGCKVNQYESDGLILKLKQAGHEVYSQIVPADVYILNSCAVTNEAEKKSRQVLAKFKEANPNARIMVCGCASEKNSSQFQDIDGVKFISGTANKMNLINSLEKIGVYKDEIPTVYNDEYEVIPSKTRAYIKIQDGCNNFCTYCIIPYLRGRSRSRSLESILSEIKQLSKTVKEIVITGIDITDYKIDGKRALGVLANKLKEFKNVRFRLGSIEQGLIEEEFVKEISNSNICPHFHLSLQSGCDTVLKRMNRKYTTKEFEKSVEILRKYFNNPSITTDVIVGFPEETDNEFKQTCEFVKKIGFYNIHIFPYSKRSGTVAERMKQVDGNVKKERVKILQNINKNLNIKYILSCINNVYSVLIEEQIDGYSIGHTENYIKCYIKGSIDENQIVKAKIVKPYKDGAMAENIVD
ncbi:MAG: tRNA (N(6)-L-threonylcarbamoyladenosine(37)-C(2))-methylthiotransferase MtaB [Clostridia bacterium]|nr:tRNA (N(6)-L-threonylcarbamoyladenosine(37)-C(2))-methylthiotransferase MtaB [Clostridia bacterium]